MTQQIQQPPQQHAIQRRPQEPLPFVPGNMEEAWRTSDLLAKASILPDALKGKPHDVLVAVLTGAELGISPMQAIREVYVVKGKPFIASLLRVAIVRQSPECLAWQLVESTDQRATYRTQRRADAQPTTMSYTIKEAEASGLVAQNAKYRTDPALMLRRRCAGRLIDEVYPDIIRGVGDRDTDADAAEVETTGPARVTPIRIASTSAPTAPEQRHLQPEEAQEVTPLPSPALQEEPARHHHGLQADVATFGGHDPAPTQPGEPTLAEVLLAEIDGSTTEKDLDAITARAQRDMPKGPERQAVGKAISARRAELKGAR